MENTEFFQYKVKKPESPGKIAKTKVNISGCVDAMNPQLSIALRPSAITESPEHYCERCLHRKQAI